MTSTAPPDTLLTQVGFEKTKVGSGDKDVGYQVKESTLGSLIGSLVLCFGVMGLLVVGMVYDVHLEKKTFHRQIRIEEHHAASKLAQVQMELWGQYREDVAESHEAAILMKRLEASVPMFETKLQTAVAELAQELNLHQDRSKTFADKILHLVADMQKENVKHAKHLVDHLVEAGKRGKKLEKRVDSQMQKEMKDEQKLVETEGLPEEIKPPGQAAEGGKAGDAADPLKAVLDGFFFTFNDYEAEFGGEARKDLVHGNPIYEALKVLYEKLGSENPPSEEDVSEQIDKLDLSSVGAGLGSGRILPASDIVEELVLISEIPHVDLKALEKDWKAGKKDSVAVFAELESMHTKNLIPSGWLKNAVNREEKDEAEETIPDGTEEEV